MFNKELRRIKFYMALGECWACIKYILYFENINSNFYLFTFYLRYFILLASQPYSVPLIMTEIFLVNILLLFNIIMQCYTIIDTYAKLQIG